MMSLDECTPYPCEYEYAVKSIKLTSEWAVLNKEAFDTTKPFYGHKQFLFGIIQGSVYKDLREKSANDLLNWILTVMLSAVLAVGEPTEIMYDIIDFTTEFMPENKPRYLMGVGRPKIFLKR